jgi:hypothetical protein
LLPLLNERGYQPIEMTSVMYRPLGRGLPLPPLPQERVQSRLIGEKEEELWASTAAYGWSEMEEIAEIILELCYITAKRQGGLSFLAELDRQPIAAGAMFLHDGVALLAGASTIPGTRRQGAQRSVLESRLRYAAEQGCDLAMMCAAPGSASQRNAERQGFRIAYTRIKWRQFTILERGRLR